MKSSIWSLRNRLFLAFVLITVLATAVPAFFFRNMLYADHLELAQRQALTQALFTGRMLESSLTERQLDRVFDYAKELSLRMTMADASDKVVRDSHVGVTALSDLDNHGDRPEIIAAHAKGQGISVRHSNTLGIDAVYAAIALQNGGTLRVAVPLASVRSGLQAELVSLGGFMVGVAALCLLLAVVITTRIRNSMDSMAEVVASISRDKGRHRLHDVPGREFLPLAHAVNHMADNIEQYVALTNDQQSQLSTILDSIHEGVLVLGPSGNIRRWNRAMSALFPDVAVAEGKPLIEGLPVPTLQRKVDVLLHGNAEIAERQPQADAEMLFPESEAMHFEWPVGRFLVAHLARPLQRTDALGAVIVVYDATEIMRLERVRRDFVSNVSHELRTPLTAIAGYAETLENSGDLPENYRHFAGIIHRRAAMMGQVISDLLALSRVENTRESMPLNAVRAKAALEAGMASVREQAEAKGLSFAVDLDDTPVMANAPLLERVFRNLLENACRYSPQGGTVRIFSRRQGERVLFTVADNGPGIPKEELPRIFERFYQIKKERNSGTAGIGLAICKHIIERHDGRIWAESPYEGAATAMLFTLPAAEPV